MRELKNIEEKILDRALYLIGKNRSCDITIRAIAKEANVNISAINYYFRTKEEMLIKAKGLYIINVLSILSFFENDEFSEEDKLILAANEIMEYIIRYPGITVILSDATNRTDETSKNILKVSEKMTNQINETLDYILKEEGPVNKYKHLIFWASINYPVENGELTGIDTTMLKNKASRIDYIKQIIYILKDNG